MARWEPNARQRFVTAAVDLFAEQGYETTTVNEIAERAGLTKTTFFRHFSDKREVLFAGQEIHNRIVTEAIAAAPAGTAPLDVVAAAVDALATTFAEERREFSARLQTVMAANNDLQERAVFKRASLAAAMTDALRRRGVPALTASLAADLGVRAFHEAFENWATPSEPPDRAAASSETSEPPDRAATPSETSERSDGRGVPGGKQPMTALARQALDELRSAISALG